MLARWFGDPTNDMRRAWVEQLSDGRPSDFTIRDYADQAEISVLVLGDTGEGDGSQYALVPGLVSESAGTAFAFVLSDVIYPAGGIDDYENKFYRPYKDYPGPIYAVPGNHDWYDDLTGFRFTFCGVRRPPPRVPGPGSGFKRFLRKALWRHAPKGTAKAIERMQALRPAAAQRSRQPGHTSRSRRAPCCSSASIPASPVRSTESKASGFAASRAHRRSRRSS
jgi:hypothetical protein